MPIYEYICENCHHQLEKLQKMSDAPLTDCPVCHQAKLVKCISVTGFQLKGTGWYATDFKPNKSKNSSTTCQAAGCSHSTCRSHQSE